MLVAGRVEKPSITYIQSGQLMQKKAHISSDNLGIGNF